MAYILGLVVVAFFFLAMHYFTELDKKQKTIVSVVVFTIIFGAIAFNLYSTSQRDKMLDVVMRFNQHKTVQCKSIKVNDKNFTLSIGTYTFIGNKDTPNYAQMISATECR